MSHKPSAKTTDPGTVNALGNKTILLVNTGPAKKRFILQKLKKLGLKTVVLHKEKNWAQPYVDHWIVTDNTNHVQAIQAIQKFLASHPTIAIDGAVTFWEDDVLLTSKIIDKFNFIGIPYDVARTIRNKYLFRQFCLGNKIPVPKFHMAKSMDDLDYVSKHFAFPLVIKPAYGSSSAFVMKVKNKKELLETYRFITNAISTNVESALNDGLDIFIEEYLDGDEVDIDLLIQNGKVKFCSLSDNYNKDKGSFFLDSGQAIPSSLPIKAQEELTELAEEVIERAGIQNGCIHFEGKYTKYGPFPIEVNLRMGGDYVYSYTRDSWGVDLIEYATKIAVGEYIKPIDLEVPKKYIIGWDIHPEDSGVLAELDIDEAFEKKDYVEEFQLYKELGDPVLVPPEGFEQLGWMTISGENLLDAQDNLDAALEMISFKVVKFEHSSALGKTERKDRFSSAVLNKNLLLRMAKIEMIKKTNLENIKNLPLGLLCNMSSDTTDNPLNATPLEIEEILTAKGYDVTLLNADNLPMVIDKLRKSNIDLVFNIAIGEKFHLSPKYKPHIASFLDLMQIPYTGSDPFTLFLAFDKIRFKKILSYHDIPTPRWDYLRSVDEKLDPELEFPLVIKPAIAIHSVGVSKRSVVTNKKALKQELEFIIKTMGMPALVEEYIEGDEYDAYILGNDKNNLQVLPLRRSVFENLPHGEWHIYTSENKIPGAKNEHLMVHQLPPKNISKKLQSLISEMALDTYSIFGCQDYGKIKIKTDEDGNPYVLELNPNPSLHRELGFARSAEMARIPYANLIEEILYLAVNRYKNRGSPSLF